MLIISSSPFDHVMGKVGGLRFEVGNHEAYVAEA
jgi:hypothetical protein